MVKIEPSSIVFFLLMVVLSVALFSGIHHQVPRLHKVVTCENGSVSHLTMLFCYDLSLRNMIFPFDNNTYWYLVLINASNLVMTWLIIYRVASAPGKVLMTGGYLVLERPNAGIVLSTNARFYAIVKPFYEEAKPDSWAWVCKTSADLSSCLRWTLSFSLLAENYDESFVACKISLCFKAEEQHNFLRARVGNY